MLEGFILYDCNKKMEDEGKSQCPIQNLGK